MFASYLKIALRSLGKHKGYTFINVVGLGVGLGCFILIMLFVRDEQQYDRFHEHADRIYRVVIDAQPPNSPPDRFALVSQPVAPAIRAEVPGVAHVVRLNGWGPTLTHNGEDFYDDTFFFAEPTFFDIFSFPLIAGDPETALSEPYTLVLTAAMQEKYFGTEEALGQTLVLNDSLSFTVTGVLADVPRNSHFNTDFLVSYATYLTFSPEHQNWLNLGIYTYLMLQEGSDVATVGPQVAGLMTKHFGDQLSASGFEVTLPLQPLTEIYLHSDRGGEIGRVSDATYVYVFSAIALFVLMIACINFMNLATARSLERAREVGIRKVVGSSRGRLVGQFLLESVLLVTVGLVVALGLVAGALPFVNTLAEKAFTFGQLGQPDVVAGLLGLVLVVGLLAGTYPALVLSSFQPVQVLKGTFRSSRRGVVLRQGLVVFQFTISVVLIASTLVVFQQLDFMQSQQLGFEKAQVYVVNAQQVAEPGMAEGYQTLKTEFARHPAVTQASASNVVPGRSPWVIIYNAEGLAEGDSRRAQVTLVDHDYVETFGIALTAGRDFDADFETDGQGASVVVNEAMVESVGWGTPDDALGKTVDLMGQTREVVGVIRDYHHLSLKQAIEPMILMVRPQSFAYVSLRLSTDDLPGTLAALEGTWASLYPALPYEGFFLDDDFDAQYQNEARLSRIFGIFAGIAILIACLGLFGLAAFMAQQRTKEIGVRKVMGASTVQVITMLSSAFVRLVLIGVVLAMPVVYLAMNRWLETFPYHTEIGWSVYLVSGAMAVLIALATISYQATKAALLDPAKSLRYE